MEFDPGQPDDQLGFKAASIHKWETVVKASFHEWYLAGF